MVKRIIACSDIHIRNLRRQDEYAAQLRRFLDRCREIVSEYGEDEVRIVVAGDVVHSKLDISPEGYMMAGWFLGELNGIAKTIVIAGNHDLNMHNLTRVDTLSTIFSMTNYDNVVYLDRELDYQSGCHVDDNIVWCLYSTFDGFAQPNITETRIQNPDSVFVGLYHGEINSARSDANYVSENCLGSEHFDGLDFGILGHIHRHQCIRHNGIPLVYCSSLIQQDAGENVSGHGFVLWDVEKTDYKLEELPNDDYGFYVMSIENENDIEEGKEEIINL